MNVEQIFAADCTNSFRAVIITGMHLYISTWKIVTTEKLRVMLYLVGIFRTSSPGDGLSSNPERTAPRRWGEEPGYREVLLEMASSLNIKRLLFIKENQISQVKEFSNFLFMGRCKSLGSLKSFFWYASQISWRRKWQRTPISLPGKSHGQRSLVDCSPWSHKELGTTEQLTQYLSSICLLQSISFVRAGIIFILVLKYPQLIQKLTCFDNMLKEIW